MKTEPIKTGKYLHYKTGRLYEVIGVALYSETQEEMVIYEALYYCDQFGDQQKWVRSKKMFVEYVEYNGSRVPRFKAVD